MITITTKTRIAGVTARQITDFLLEPSDESYQRWWPGTHLEFHDIKRVNGHVGNRIFMDEIVGKRRIRMVAEVVEARPGRKLVWQMRKGVRLPSRVILELEDEGGGMVAITHTIITRRDALKRIGGLAGMAALPSALAACDGGGDPIGITTYVYLMLENRTYDHVLGARAMLEGKPGNGLTAGITNPDLDGNPVGLFEPTSAIEQICIAADPPHGWTTSRQQWNGGANDGFVRVHQMEHGGSRALRDPMQYLTRTQVPITWALADAYTTCDRWFASLMGPTLPNRFYWHAATSCGFRSNSVIDSVSELCESSGGSLRLLDPISEAADRHPKLFDGYDLRADHELYLASIERFLKRHQRS